MALNRGIVTVVKRKAHQDPETGEWIAGDIIDSFTVKNVVTYEKNREELIDSADTSGVQIWVSEKDRVANLAVCPLGDSEDMIQGADIGGIDRFVYTPPSAPDPGFWTVSQRIAPPVGSPRSIEFIGLSPANGNFDDNTVKAYVALVTPCPQALLEILDIFYRITIDETVTPVVNGAWSWSVEDIGEKLWFSGSYASLRGYPREFFFQWSPNITDQKQKLGIWEIQESTPTIVNDQHYSWKSLESNFILADDVGSLFGAVNVGRVGGSMGALAILRPGDTPIQSLFGKTASSIIPFLDAANAATGTGTVTPLGGSWTNPDLPFQYRIEITVSGATGVSQYKFARRRILGYFNNTYESRNGHLQSWRLHLASANQITQNGEQIFQAGGDTRHGQNIDTSLGAISSAVNYGTANDSFRGFRQTNMNGRLAYPEILSFDDTGITIMDVSTDTVVEHIDVDSTFALAVTELSQVDIESDGTIWAADRNTGLYRIDRSGGAVTAVTRITGGGLSGANDASCYGVAVKRSNDDIWAIFVDTLAQSTDGGTTWTLYNSGTAAQYVLTGFSGVGEYNKHTMLFIDPTHADDRLFLGAPDTVRVGGASGGRVISWSRANSNPTSDAVRTSGSSFADALAHPEASTWCSISNNGFMYAHTASSSNNIIRLTFGSGTGTSITANNPSVDQGVILIDDGAGNDLVVGRQGNSWVGRTDAQLGTTGFTTDMGPGVLNTHEGVVGSDRLDSLRVVLDHGVLFHYINQDMSNGTGSYAGFFLSTGGISSSPKTQSWDYALWEEYGWNGANWILDNVNGKTTHGSNDTLIDGLTVAFADGGGAPHFVNTEYYVFGVYDGLFKDDATTFDYEAVMPFTQSEAGVTFTPGTVPGTDIGSVVNEPAAWRFYSTEVAIYSEPGDVCSSFTSGSRGAQAEAELEGNITIDFGIDPIQDDSATTTFAFGLALMPFADQSAITAWNDASVQHGLAFKQILATDDLTWQVWENGSLVTSGTIAFASFDRKTDVFTIQRSGAGVGNVTYRYNAAILYTSLVESTGAKCCKYISASSVGACYNVQIDYIANKRLVSIGNGTTTGRANINFRHVPLTLVPSLVAFTINAVPATLLIDGLVAPAAGEIQVLKSGQLIFNTADAGLAVAGNWLTNLKLNLV